MSDARLQEIIETEKQGYRATAVKQLSQYLREKPDSAEGWYYMARFSADPRQQYKAIQRASRLAPQNKRVQEFLEILLREHPQLQPKRSRTLKFMLVFSGIALIIAAGVAAGILTGFFEEPTREVVIIIPTASDTPPVTEQPFVIETKVPTETPAQITPSPQNTLVPSDTPEPAITIVGLSTAFVSVTPAPTSTVEPSPFPTLEINNPSARLVVLSPVSDEIDSQIQGFINPAYLQAEIAENTITSQADAQTIAAEKSAALVIYGSSDEIHLYAQEDSQQTLNRPELLPLSRLSNPWAITLTGNDWQNALRAALAYLTYQHQDVVAALESRFENVRGVLSEDEIRLAGMLAYSYQALGEHETALPLYDFLIGYTEDPHIKANRAWAVAESGDSESAITLYLSLLDKHPDPSFIQTNIGEIYSEFPESANSAHLAYDEAINLDPRAPRPHIGKGRLLMMEDDFNGAMTEFNNAVNVATDYAPAYFVRAQLRVTLGLLDDAYSDVSYAITLQPDVGEYYLLQGQILYGKKEWGMARQAFEVFLQHSTPNPEVYTFLAESYLNLNGADDTIHVSNQALELNPEYAPAWFVQGKAYLLKNDQTNALNAFNQGLQHAPENVDLLVARCTLHAQMGDDGAAASDCDAALALDPVNGLALEQRGLIRGRAGDRAGAASDFQEAVIYYPEAEQAYFYLGLYALQEKRYDDTVTNLTKAIEFMPEPGAAYAARGVAYRIMGQWQQAVEDFEQALLLVPDDEYTYYELGLAKRGLADLVYETGNIQQAEVFYQEALNAFNTFIERAEANNPYLGDAQAGLDYVTAALAVFQQATDESE